MMAPDPAQASTAWRATDAALHATGYPQVIGCGEVPSPADSDGRPDADLLVAASQGDTQSFSIFFRRHVKPVTRYGLRRCSDPNDVADLVSDTFLIALQASGRYEPQTHTALPWLFGIARRVLARQRRRVSSSIRLARKAGAHELLVEGDEAEAIAAAIDASRQREDLEAALATLSSGEREVFVLVAFDGLTLGEAAIALGMNGNAARLRLSRARKRLRDELEPEVANLGEARHAY